MNKHLEWKLGIVAIALGVGFVSVMAGCVAQRPEGATPSALVTESPQQTSASAPAQMATYDATALDVEFSFEYPAAWSVSNESNGSFDVRNEENVRVASLVIQPNLEVEPCRFSCADAAVSYLGEIPGKGSLDGNSFVVRTKAMDLTSREDQRNAYGWAGNVLLVLGIEGGNQKPAHQDPSHFDALAGIQVTPDADGTRPIRFMAIRTFNTLTEARTYTSTAEHADIREMLASFTAQPQAGRRANSSTPTAGPS